MTEATGDLEITEFTGIAAETETEPEDAELTGVADELTGVADELTGVADELTGATETEPEDAELTGATETEPEDAELTGAADEQVLLALTQRRMRCYGCKTGILNQLGHMEPGGCLYESEDVAGEQVEADEQVLLALTQRRMRCYGCKTGVLNQLGHMEPGGCLYDSEDDE